jgi:hypothetical protein
LRSELDEFNSVADQFEAIKYAIFQFRSHSQLFQEQSQEALNLGSMLAQANEYMRIYKENETEYMKEREELYYSRMVTRERVVDIHGRL